MCMWYMIAQSLTNAWSNAYICSYYSSHTWESDWIMHTSIWCNEVKPVVCTMYHGTHTLVNSESHQMHLSHVQKWYVWTAWRRGEGGEGGDHHANLCTSPHYVSWHWSRAEYALNSMLTMQIVYTVHWSSILHLGVVRALIYIKLSQWYNSVYRENPSALQLTSIRYDYYHGNILHCEGMVACSYPLQRQWIEE